MIETWVALILVGLAASLMPLTIGVEIYAMGTEKGIKKVISLIAGVTVFRLLLTVGILLVSAGLIARRSEEGFDIGEAIRTALYNFDQALTSGERLIGNIFIILAGLLILFQMYRMMRSQPVQEGDPLSKPPDARAVGAGIFGMLWIGFILTLTNVNQWVLIPVGVNQILRMEGGLPVHLIAYIWFLFFSTVVILLPFLIYVVRPKQATSDLKTLNRWINHAMRYLFAGLFFLVAIYFIWKGGVGVINHFFL